MAAVLSLLLPVASLAQVGSYTISTIAGSHVNGYNGDGRPATGAELNSPAAVLVDSSRNVYISDSGNERVREVKSGTIYLIAGDGSAGYLGDGGKATGATLNTPYGLAFDAAGNLYIADLGNYVVRKVTTGGIISTVAGNDTIGFAGDGGAATSAVLNNPIGLAVDSSGNLCSRTATIFAFAS